MNEYEVALRQFLEDEGYTNIEISEGYDENNFEVETDEEDMEFFVGTYDESYEAAKQDVLSLLDEIGIDSLSPDYDWTEFVDDDYFEEAYEEMERGYLEDIRNEDDYKNIYANRLIQEVNEGIKFGRIRQDDFFQELYVLNKEVIESNNFRYSPKRREAEKYLINKDE